MDSASIPPRQGHMRDPDPQPFKMHSPATLRDDATVLLSDKKPATHVLHTTTTIVPPSDAPAPPSTDATPPNNHHNQSHIRDQNHNHPHTIHRQPFQPVMQQQQQQQHQQQLQPKEHQQQHRQQTNPSRSIHDRPTTTTTTTDTPIAPTTSSQDRSSASVQRPVPSIPSQDSSLSTESANVFTPPASQGDMSLGNANGHTSSQESQLLHLSHIAAAQDKLAEDNVMATARKRMADGALKDNTSPVRIAHSRNTSTVSMASTAASSVGDWSSDLKTRLSYAMLKVNHGWQSHSIDEVESMASQAASPTSSHSTLHGRHDPSASPRANMARYAPTSAATATTASSNPSPATYESFWKDGQRSAYSSTSPPQTQNHPALAPPAPIQPSRPMHNTNNTNNPRRNSNPRYTPTLLSHSHSASPHTPSHRNHGATPNQRLGRTPLLDPVLFSPHQNVREQDAIESLLFMSSPGNSANMKNTYSSSMAAAAAAAAASNMPSRHALPGSQPRKSLPSQRPMPQKRVGFEKSPGGMTAVSDMDIDMDSPQSRGPTRRRRINGSASFSAGSGPSTLRPQLSLPAALGSTSRPRPRLADADIERMIDQAAQAGDSSDDDDDEIQIPPRNRPEGAVGV
ncbi:hypothetical protein LX32DRAFT_586342 [Colletotrichum zoysiae]|uniref:Cyclin-dependent kinase n=1 Tax=Colletotrichum zoysiae TaxID=1216348 RepID=A0AAD9M3I9_9PEZI|nr:hypothetical protein LX32DRAFT_586342 [Colletotrichum zoysiae]